MRAVLSAQTSCDCLGGAAIKRAKLPWAVCTAEPFAGAFVGAVIDSAQLYFLYKNGGGGRW